MSENENRDVFGNVIDKIVSLGTDVMTGLDARMKDITDGIGNGFNMLLGAPGALYSSLMGRDTGEAMAGAALVGHGMNSLAAASAGQAADAPAMGSPEPKMLTLNKASFTEVASIKERTGGWAMTDPGWDKLGTDTRHGIHDIIPKAVPAQATVDV